MKNTSKFVLALLLGEITPTEAHKLLKQK